MTRGRRGSRRHSGLWLDLFAAFAGLAVFLVGFMGVTFWLQAQRHFETYLAEVGRTADPFGFGPANAHFRALMASSLLITGALGLVLAALLGLAASWYLARPLRQMAEVARRMRDGDLSARVAAPGRGELGLLGCILNHLAASLEEQERLRRQLTADVAHELRTPLATLRGHLEAFLDGVWEPTPERLRDGYEEVVRLASLVEDLEDVALAEGGGLVLQRESIDLESFVASLLNLVTPSFLARRQVLAVRVEARSLRADPRRLKQVLLNLLANANRYAPEGGHVDLEVTEEDGEVVFRVRDDGPGIAEEDLPYVFDRFYRADRSRNRATGGSGLGLTVVRSLVEAHGGRVTVRSRPGEGTVFEARFPA
ncbi:MAG: HAMP domain-containing protein [Clostridia bacterium]|nr:HAMP domain-containing protein [Clostridia bacterium]